jgi:hypothetical protein
VCARGRPSPTGTAAARNLVIDEYRARATRGATGDALARTGAVGDSAAPSADSDVLERERLDALDRAIRQLAEHLRVVLVLQAVGERTSSGIGELLGRPAGTVRYHLAEARRLAGACVWPEVGCVADELEQRLARWAASRRLTSEQVSDLRARVLATDNQTRKFHPACAHAVAMDPRRPAPAEARGSFM